jgi:hypothetical protein
MTPDCPPLPQHDPQRTDLGQWNTPNVVARLPDLRVYECVCITLVQRPAFMKLKLMKTAGFLNIVFYDNAVSGL